MEMIAWLIAMLIGATLGGVAGFLVVLAAFIFLLCIAWVGNHREEKSAMVRAQKEIEDERLASEAAAVRSSEFDAHMAEIARRKAEFRKSNESGAGHDL